MRRLRAEVILEDAAHGRVVRHAAVDHLLVGTSRGQPFPQGLPVELHSAAELGQPAGCISVEAERSAQDLGVAHEISSSPIWVSLVVYCNMVYGIPHCNASK